MHDTVDESAHATAVERRMLDGRPAFGGALDGLRARVLDSLVGGAPPTIGRYRLDRVIGSGAFGTVWAAEDVRLGRHVAIKLITCARTPNETSRVLREARMLATVSHPNIVHVFEVGLTEDERRSPYVVMELVPGRTLRRWLGEAPRSWRDVVEVVLQAAHGLLAAHLAGVLHRDMKPDNVLVGEDGRPRIIDFGLARSLDDHQVDSAVHTLGSDTSTDLTPTGQVMGTPAYMAPEVFTSGCTAQSDQYSLCVTMYEALFGARPFQARSAADLRVQLLTHEPRLPDDRRRVPKRVQRVVMRGLRRDADQRHPDLSAFIDALERAVKPARALPLVVLAGGLLATTAVIGADRETACTTADRAWEPARAVARVSDAVEHSRIAYERAWRDTEAQLCAAGTGAIDADERHCLDERARDAIALLVVLSELDESDPHRDDDPLRDLAAPADCAAPDHDVVARPDNAVAVRVERLEQPLSRLRALATTWQIADGLELATSLGHELRELDYAPMLVEVGYLHGRLLFQASDYAGAARAFEDAFLVAQREHLDRFEARCATELLRVEGYYRGDVESARRWGARADAAFLRAGVDPSSQPTYLLGLAGLAEREDELARAVELLQQALDVEGPRSPFRATLLNHLGIAHYRRGSYDECVTALADAAASFEEFHGAVSPSRSSALGNLGLCLTALGRYEEALTHHRESLAIREVTLDDRHTDLAASHGNLADVLDHLGRYDEALTHIEEARRVFVARVGEDHPYVAQALEIRGRIRMHGGRRDQAREDFARASRMYAEAGTGHAAEIARVDELARELEGDAR
jgi:tetratricopeptide (TPR) repeat protein/predicted Ser/Thr protein kinase